MRSLRIRFSSLSIVSCIGLATGVVGAVAGGCAEAPAPSDHLATENVAQTKDALTTCVTLRRSTSTVADATISRAAMNQEFGSHKTLQVDKKREALIRFDLSGIPSSAVVDSATLKLQVQGDNGCDHHDDDDDDDRRWDDDHGGQHHGKQWHHDQGHHDAANIRIHRVKQAWTESTVNFANFDQRFDSAVSAYLQTSSHNAQKSADVKGLVAAWVSGAKVNHGFLLETSASRATVLVSSESQNASLRPALEVCYTTPDDHCTPDPCVNGTCQNGPSSYTCQCDAGWTGTNCETNIDDCAGSPCQNGGACTDGVNGYTCACAAGFSGANCETNIDDCAGSPCQNGGVCTDEVNQYSCDCVPGFSGANCETNIDECAGAPCLNGGVCTDGANSYTCACATGFSGANCETNIDDCAGEPCQNAGTCNDGVASYTCTCVAGYEGTSCETNIDECAGAPCVNGGTCTDGVNEYTCACAAGYTGTNCEEDIDECAANPCVHGLCLDKIAAYQCICEPGYTGTECEEDIDECAVNPCVHGLCLDLVAAYQCQCEPGYTGTTCDVPDDPCASNPCLNGGTCVGEGNGYYCVCPLGAGGQDCEIPWDACEGISCQNGGTCDPAVAVVGEPCECPAGFAGAFCQYADICQPGEVFENGACGAPTVCPCSHGTAWAATLGTQDGLIINAADTGETGSVYATDPAALDSLSQGAFTPNQSAAGLVYDPLDMDYPSGACAFASRPLGAFIVSDLTQAEALLCLADVQAANTPAEPVPDLPAPFAFLGAGLAGLAAALRNRFARKSVQ